MNNTNLMVGNYVYNRKHKIYKIKAIIFGYALIGYKLIKISNLRPITVTPDLLKLNGFKRIEDSNNKNTYLLRLNKFPKHIKITIHYDIMGSNIEIYSRELIVSEIPFEYVHELQNILNICKLYQINLKVL